MNDVIDSLIAARFWIPELLVFAAAVLCSSVNRNRLTLAAWLILAAAASSIFLGPGEQLRGWLMIDPLALLVRSSLLTLVGLALLVKRDQLVHPESVWAIPAVPLMTFGLLLVCSASHVLPVLIGMEFAVVPLLLAANRVIDDDRRHALARGIVTHGVASVLFLIGAALLYVLGGSGEFTRIKLQMALAQINAGGAISYLLAPASLMLLAALWLRAGWPPLHVLDTGGQAFVPAPLRTLFPALIGLSIVVLFFRLFVNCLFAFHDPVMAPNDWGRTVGVVVAIMGVAAVIHLFRSRNRTGMVQAVMVLQFGWLLLGALTFQAEGLAACGGMVVQITLVQLLLLAARGDASEAETAAHAGLWNYSRTQTLVELWLIALLAMAPGTPGFLSLAGILDSVLAKGASPDYLWLWPVLLVLMLSTLALWYQLGRQVLLCFQSSIEGTSRLEADYSPLVSRIVLTGMLLLVAISLYPLPYLQLLQGIPFGFGFSVGTPLH